MKLDLDRDPVGRSRVAVAESSTLERGDEELVAVALSGSLVVDNLESRVVVTGNLEGSCQVACDRCLEDFALTFEVPVEILVIRDFAPESEPDVCVIHQRVGLVDLDPALREASLLALPQKRLCTETCRGLCPACGGNRNLTACDCAAAESDPRWEGLPSD